MSRRGNKLVVGTTQSGKSYAELWDVIGTAASRRTALVVIDPHVGSLARKSLVHLIARGHQPRIIWDELSELESTPKYRLLTPSRARNPLVRAKENQQQAEQFTELLCRRREQQSLATSPLTEEWTRKAGLLL